MNWEVCLVCSIYDRNDWNGGLQTNQRPQHEDVFAAPLGDAQDRHLLTKAIAEATRSAEAWLNALGVSLVTSVVVTVYSLEVGYGNA